jgi:hypothetical protein
MASHNCMMGCNLKISRAQQCMPQQCMSQQCMSQQCMPQQCMYKIFIKHLMLHEKQNVTV